jgi:hypothetical protein
MTEKNFKKSLKFLACYAATKKEKGLAISD